MKTHFLPDSLIFVEVLNGFSELFLRRKPEYPYAPGFFPLLRVPTELPGIGSLSGVAGWNAAGFYLLPQASI